MRPSSQRSGVIELRGALRELVGSGRLWRRVSAIVLVVALTPAGVLAAPPPDETTPEPDRTAVSESTSPSPAETGALELDSTAVGAEVIAIDSEGRERSLGPLPLRADLPAGRWRLEVDAPGYRPWQTDVEIEPGATSRLQVEPELIDTALLIVEVASPETSGAELRLDGETLCTLPCRRTIDPGDHQAEIRKRRMKPLAFPLEAKQADVIELEVRLERATSRAPAIITGAVALGTLTTAIVLTVRADRIRRSLADDLEQLHQYDGSDRRIDAGRRNAVVASGLYGVTAVAFGLTLFYLLRQAGQPSRIEKTRRNLAFEVAPALGPTQVGVFGQLRF